VADAADGRLSWLRLAWLLFGSEFWLHRLPRGSLSCIHGFSAHDAIDKYRGVRPLMPKNFRAIGEE
jgi:hypothetical protein